MRGYDNHEEEFRRVSALVKQIGLGMSETIREQSTEYAAIPHFHPVPSIAINADDLNKVGKLLINRLKDSLRQEGIPTGELHPERNSFTVSNKHTDGSATKESASEIFERVVSTVRRELLDPKTLRETLLDAGIAPEKIQKMVPHTHADMTRRDPTQQIS